MSDDSESLICCVSANLRQKKALQADFFIVVEVQLRAVTGLWRLAPGRVQVRLLERINVTAAMKLVPAEKQPPVFLTGQKAQLLSSWVAQLLVLQPDSSLDHEPSLSASPDAAMWSFTCRG